MPQTLTLLECPADSPDTDDLHGFPGDVSPDLGGAVCVCGRRGVVREVEYPDDHPLVVALSSPTVSGVRRKRRR